MKKLLFIIAVLAFACNAEAPKEQVQTVDSTVVDTAIVAEVDSSSFTIKDTAK